MQKRKRTKAVVIITVLLCYIGLVATKSLPGSHLVDRTAHVQNERELIAALRDEEVAHNPSFTKMEAVSRTSA